jgi:plasmid stabilization system protein ParE
MLKLVWRPSARDDLRSILTYIAERNQAAAASLGQAIEACAERLPDILSSIAPAGRPARARPSFTRTTSSSIAWRRRRWRS